MDKGYELYRLADLQFYDSATIPPAGLSLPWQGWKIHTAACLDNAEHIVETIRAARRAGRPPAPAGAWHPEEPTARPTAENRT
jgi:hypothetical protein